MASPRPKPQPRLDEAAIVGAALRFVKRHGAGELSMRTLARELSVSPMALYHHVPNKDALLDAMRDAVLARIELPEPQAELWQAQLRGMAMDAIGELAAYPGLLEPGSRRAPTPAVLRLTQHGIRVLLAAGFEPREAALAIATYHTQVFGLVLQREHDQRGPRRPGNARRGAVAEVAAELRAISFQQALEHGIDTILAGLATRLR
jgi:AcrR family transcriptional regulator